MDGIDPNHPKFEAFQRAIRDALAKRLRDADEELAKYIFKMFCYLFLPKIFFGNFFNLYENAKKLS